MWHHMLVGPCEAAKQGCCCLSWLQYHNVFVCQHNVPVHTTWCDLALGCWAAERDLLGSCPTVHMSKSHIYELLAYSHHQVTLIISTLFTWCTRMQLLRVFFTVQLLAMAHPCNVSQSRLPSRSPRQPRELWTGNSESARPDDQVAHSPPLPVYRKYLCK